MCRYEPCSKSIMFGRGPSGKAIPVDVERVKLSTLPPAELAHTYEVDRQSREGPVLRKVDAHDRAGHRSHFRTCTDPARFSKKG